MFYRASSQRARTNNGVSRSRAIYLTAPACIRARILRRRCFRSCVLEIPRASPDKNESLCPLAPAQREHIEWLENILKGTRIYIPGSFTLVHIRFLSAFTRWRPRPVYGKVRRTVFVYCTELFVYTARAIRGAIRWPAAHEFVVSIFGSSGRFSVKGHSAAWWKILGTDSVLCISRL